MVLRKVVICFICLSFSIIQSQNKEASLVGFLKELENHFQVTFNYESSLIKNKPCKKCKVDNKKSLEENLTFLQSQFGFLFQRLTDDKIVIYKFTPKYLQFYDADDLLPIKNAIILSVFSNNTWRTNSKGEIRFIKKTPKEIQFLKEGYNKTLIAIDSLKTCKIYLSKRIESLDEIFLYPYFTNGTSKNKRGDFFIEVDKMNTIAGLTNQDIIKSLENLPQVISNSESASDLMIKGGTHDQNLFIWNDIKVYQSHHFFGLISAFNENLISKISLYDNATPSKYGNSTSGVISLDHDKKISKETELGFGFDFLSTNVFFKIPISKKSALQFSTRSSLTQFWDSPTYLRYSKKIFQSSLIDTKPINNNNIISDNEFEFQDYQLQFSYHLNQNNSFHINALQLKNNLFYIEEDAFNTQSKQSDLTQQNYGVGLQWQHLFRNTSKLQAYVNYSNYDLDASNFLLSRNISSTQKNAVENFETRLEYEYKPKKSFSSFMAGFSHENLTVKNNTTDFNSLFTSNIKQVSTLYNLFGTWNYRREKIHSGVDVRNVYYGLLNSFQIEPRFYFNPLCIMI